MKARDGEVAEGCILLNQKRVPSHAAHCSDAVSSDQIQNTTHAQQLQGDATVQRPCRPAGRVQDGKNVGSSQSNTHTGCYMSTVCNNE